MLCKPEHIRPSACRLHLGTDPFAVHVASDIPLRGSARSGERGITTRIPSSSLHGYGGRTASGTRERSISPAKKGADGPQRDSSPASRADGWVSLHSVATILRFNTVIGSPHGKPSKSVIHTTTTGTITKQAQSGSSIGLLSFVLALTTMHTRFLNSIGRLDGTIQTASYSGSHTISHEATETARTCSC